ncbi:MAG: response regulator [Daejeonella sp.]
MRKRILICDDDLDLLSVCKLALEEAGWEVFTRSHCRQILSILNEVNPDIILMDNWIPDSGGIVTTKAIKRPQRNRRVCTELIHQT